MLPIYACNDTLSDKNVTLKVTDVTNKKVLYEGSFVAEKNKTTKITRLQTYYSEKKFLIFEWTADGESGWNHYFCGYPPIDFKYYKKIMEEYNFGEK